MTLLSMIELLKLIMDFEEIASQTNIEVYIEN